MTLCIKYILREQVCSIIQLEDEKLNYNNNLECYGLIGSRDHILHNIL